MQHVDFTLNRMPKFALTEVRHFLQSSLCDQYDSVVGD